MLVAPRPIPIFVGVACFALACSPAARVVRMGDPVRLSTGRAQSVCEQARWLDLVPVRGFAQETDLTGYSRQQDSVRIETRTISVEAPGYAIYQGASVDPIALASVLPQMNQVELHRLHMQRIDGILRRDGTGRKLAWLGMGLAVTGLVGFIPASNAESGATGVFVAASLIGSATGLVGVALMPPANERSFALVRKHVLIPGEDDLAAAALGVGFVNRSTRVRCSSRG